MKSAPFSKSGFPWTFDLAFLFTELDSESHAEVLKKFGLGLALLNDKHGVRSIFLIIQIENTLDWERVNQV